MLSDRKNYYSNNHLFFTGMVIVILIYAWYSDKKYHETTEDGMRSSQTVVRQFCRNGSRSNSRVMIHVIDRDYSVKLNYDICLQFPVGSSINVYYLKKYNEYMYKVSDYHDRLNGMIVILMISLLPWTYVYNRCLTQIKKIN